MESSGILIREISVADAEAAARLSTELGYSCEPAAMSLRIKKILSSRLAIVYIAEASSGVVGWIDVAILHHLATGAYAEIGGLIVSSEYRNAGIGRKLMTKAEEWAANQGLTRMVVRSRTTREAAHRFYLGEGYSMTKTSTVFSKELVAVRKT